MQYFFLNKRLGAGLKAEFFRQMPGNVVLRVSRNRDSALHAVPQHPGGAGRSQVFSPICFFCKDIHFNFTVQVAVSPMFLSWVMGFGSKAKILYPQSVADALCDLCRDAMSQY